MKTYIYANSQIIAQHTGDHEADRYFYLHDRLGNVRQIIDTSGNVKNRYTYDPFGELYSDPDFEETVDNSFKFTGQYFDSEIGQYYLRARQYDPHIARFTTRDPVSGKFKEPLTLHLYLYCGNDPLNKIDPSGLRFKHHDLFETQMILEFVNLLVGTNIVVGPVAAFGPGGVVGLPAQFDFKNDVKWDGDTFTIASHPGRRIGTSMFGNYAAGYSTYYHYGLFGEGGARSVGILYALSEADYGDPERPFAEEVGSQFWITQGALDANIARSKSVRFSIRHLTSPDNTFGNLLDRWRLTLWLEIFKTGSDYLDFDLYQD